MSNDNTASSSSEWTKFGVLIIVMIGIVLVVGLSRPFLFGHIIPIILGQGNVAIRPPLELSPPVLSAPLDNGPAGKAVEAPGEPEAISPTAGEENADREVEVPAADTEAQLTEAESTAEAAEAPAAGAAALSVQGETDAQTLFSPSDQPTVHVVKTGDTLIAIADQYGVTVNAIVAANGLASPNRIKIGERLTIPQP